MSASAVSSSSSSASPPSASSSSSSTTPPTTILTVADLILAYQQPLASDTEFTARVVGGENEAIRGLLMIAMGGDYSLLNSCATEEDKKRSASTKCSEFSHLVDSALKALEDGPIGPTVSEYYNQIFNAAEHNRDAIYRGYYTAGSRMAREIERNMPSDTDGFALVEQMRQLFTGFIDRFRTIPSGNPQSLFRLELALVMAVMPAWNFITNINDRKGFKNVIHPEVSELARVMRPLVDQIAPHLNPHSPFAEWFDLSPIPLT